MLFRGKYEFLSNFYPCLIVDRNYPDLIYNSVEAAFQATKTLNREERKSLTHIDPSQARMRRRNLKLREDWENIKDSVMTYYCRQKFSDPELRRKLIAVDKPIVEDNFWKDRYWGVYNGTGQNKLGKILTKIRKEALQHKVE